MQHGYVGDLEKQTVGNSDYRRVLYTGKYSQLVLMALPPGIEIGEEVHGLDQFLRFEEGTGKVVLDGVEHAVKDGSGVVVPAGTRHNVINTSPDVTLRLYSVYAPPNHADGTVHRTKADEQEEHYDGKTSE